MLKAKEIKHRITSIDATGQITQAFKIISATKLGSIKKKLIKVTPYVAEFTEIFDRLAFGSNRSRVLLSLLKKSPKRKLLIAFYTTSKGFCGGLNKQVCERVYECYQKAIAQNQQIDLLSLGEKGCLFLGKKNIPYEKRYRSFLDDISLKKAETLANFFLKAFQETMYDYVLFVFPCNVTPLEQKVVIQQILPLVSTIQIAKIDRDPVYEPSAVSMIQTLTPQLIALKLYKALLQATEAEHTARNNAMSKATDNATSLLKELNIAYNRTRQEAITKQIIETAASVEALR